MRDITMAVRIANQIQRALGGQYNAWCVESFDIDGTGKVTMEMEDYDGSSGEPYAALTVTVVYERRDE